MTFHPRSVNYWNIFFERFTQKAIWWNSCKNQQQPCRRPSPDTFRLDEDSERDLTVQVSLGDCYDAYMKIRSDTIISVNFCSNYKSELFISYSFGECKIICTVCAHNSYSYVLHYCYYFPLVTHAKFTFICTVFHRIFYRPGRDSITDKSFHVALLFLPLLIWQACSSMYIIFVPSASRTIWWRKFDHFLFLYKLVVNWKVL